AHYCRGRRVAGKRGVTTARLNEQVRRNRERFPDDFTYQLTRQEFADLMSQFATSSSAHGGRRVPSLGLHRTRRRHAVERVTAVFHWPPPPAADSLCITVAP